MWGGGSGGVGGRERGGWGGESYPSQICSCCINMYSMLLSSSIVLLIANSFHGLYGACATIILVHMSYIPVPPLPPWRQEREGEKRGWVGLLGYGVWNARPPNVTWTIWPMRDHNTCPRRESRERRERCRAELSHMDYMAHARP